MLFLMYIYQKYALSYICNIYYAYICNVIFIYYIVSFFFFTYLHKICQISTIVRQQLYYLCLFLSNYSEARTSRIRLRISCAMLFISCIALRTLVPAALFPPSAFATSCSILATTLLSFSYSSIISVSSNYELFF